MPLPLQPSLTPLSPTWRRLFLALALAVAVVVLALLSSGGARPAVLLRTGPRHAGDYARAVERLCAQARHRIWVQLYVVGEPVGEVEGLLGALAEARGRGVDVRVCLDQGRDRRTGEPDPKHERPLAWLRQRGVRAVLDEEGITTHAKALVVDSRFVVVGSHNWTRSALVANRELSVLHDDRRLAAAVEATMAEVPGW